FCGVRRYVALVISVGKNENAAVFPTPHNFLIRGFAETASMRRPSSNALKEQTHVLRKWRAPLPSFPDPPLHKH
ncbi:MAG TPA: hypothetical protein VGK77_20805, partial [Candidatus Binatia bacterium]